MGWLAADGEVTPRVLGTAGGVEAGADGTGKDTLCEPRMLRTAERTDVGSPEGTCLRIRARGVDDPCGVLNDTPVLVPIWSVATGKTLLVVVEESTDEDAEYVESEEEGALGSMPLAALTCSSCAICSVSFSTSWGDIGAAPRMPLTKPSMTVQWFSTQNSQGVEITDCQQDWRDLGGSRASLHGQRQPLGHREHQMGASGQMRGEQSRQERIAW